MHVNLSDLRVVISMVVLACVLTAGIVTSWLTVSSTLELIRTDLNLINSSRWTPHHMDAWGREAEALNSAWEPPNVAAILRRVESLDPHAAP